MHLKGFKASDNSGFAIVLTIGLVGIGLVILAGAMRYSSVNIRLNERTNEYHETLVAAEAATEKGLASMMRYYKEYGESATFANLASFRNLYPTPQEHPSWYSFQFSDGQGAVDRILVERVAPPAFAPLESQYRGLMGFTATYQIRAAATKTDSVFQLTTGVQQDIQLASIPLFQFAIFYNGYLDLNPGGTMDIVGRVHSNSDIWTGPNGNLTFEGDITSVGTNIKTRHPNDPSYNPNLNPNVTYNGIVETNVTAMNLPVGTNSSPQAVHAIIEIPPVGEPMTSPMGQQRYYNKSELLVLVSDAGITSQVKLPFDGSPIPVPESQVQDFIDTTKTFTDQREGKVMKVTEIDIGAYSTWAGTNIAVAAKLGTTPKVMFVADTRTTSSSQLTAVRLVNGQSLPAGGLTVATPEPLYVKGHYNCPNPSHLGTDETSATEPASLVSDAITILSADWLDGESNLSYVHRQAQSTTVNAGIMTGNVPWNPPTTPNQYYSGGAHNLTRYLEHWSGRTITLNTSLVSLYASTKATGLFQQSGLYYSIPKRELYYDENFMDPTKIPPGTPEVRALIRSKWAVQ